MYIQRVLSTVIKFQVDNEATQRLSLSVFITNFNLFVIKPFQNSNDNKGTLMLIGYFKELIQCHVVNSVCIALIEVSAE